MKKLLFVIFTCLPVTLCAQTWNKALQSVSRKASSPCYQSHCLRTVRHLRAVQGAFKKPQDLQVLLDNEYMPERVYVLTKADESLDVWMERSNRLLISQRIIQERNLRLLKQNGQQIVDAMQLKQTATPVLDAKRIAPGVKNVFLGEDEHLPNSLQQMQQVIKDYISRYPNKKVVLFTSFLPDSGASAVASFPAKGKYAQYMLPFKSLSARGVQIVGLEEQVSSGGWYEKNGTLLRAQDTAYGRQIRHSHWVKRIQEWRAKNPDAVFFIYTGAEHCRYDAPYSLPAALGEKDSYVVLMQGIASLKKSIFHRWSRFQFAKPGLLYPADKKWAPVVGFDEQLIF